MLLVFALLLLIFVVRIVVARRVARAAGVTGCGASGRVIHVPLGIDDVTKIVVASIVDAARKV